MLVKNSQRLVDCGPALVKNSRRLVDRGPVLVKNRRRLVKHRRRLFIDGHRFGQPHTSTKLKLFFTKAATIFD